MIVIILFYYIVDLLCNCLMSSMKQILEAKLDKVVYIKFLLVNNKIGIKRQESFKQMFSCQN